MSAGRPRPTRVVPTPAGDVAVDVSGDRGPVLLALHGIGSAAGSFAHLLDHPPAGWRVVAWDAPGYGRSADPPAAPGMDGYADAAAAVLRACAAGGPAGPDAPDAPVADGNATSSAAANGGGHDAPPPAAVLGVSWGGVIATRLALRHPALVGALVLVASSVGSGVDPARAAAMRRRADDLARLGPAAFAAQRGPRLVSPAAPAALRDAVVGTMAAAVRLPGYRWAAEAMAATDHTAELAEVTVPALVVAGTADTVTGPPDAERLRAGLPAARLHLIEGAGHLVNQERPEALDAVLHPFLSLPDIPHPPTHAGGSR
ncbi:MAG TPA: alpha/beta hydrolase [Acidimicrobiales bacterium]